MVWQMGIELVKQVYVLTASGALKQGLWPPGSTSSRVSLSAH